MKPGDKVYAAKAHSHRKDPNGLPRVDVESATVLRATAKQVKIVRGGEAFGYSAMLPPEEAHATERAALEAALQRAYAESEDLARQHLESENRAIAIKRKIAELDARPTTPHAERSE